MINELIASLVALIVGAVAFFVWGKKKHRDGMRDGRKQITDALQHHEDETRKRVREADEDTPATVDDAIDRLRRRQGEDR